MPSASSSSNPAACTTPRPSWRPERALSAMSAPDRPNESRPQSVKVRLPFARSTTIWASIVTPDCDGPPEHAQKANGEATQLETIEAKAGREECIPLYQ
jgi:hypothetical protein